MPKTSVSSLSVTKNLDNKYQNTNDLVAVEEPLEIVINHGPRNRRISERLAITMRTPGHDLELVTGFLAAEQIVSKSDDIVNIRHCRKQEQEFSENTVKVRLHPQVTYDRGQNLRHFYVNSSCGVCGKISVDSVMESCQDHVNSEGPAVSSEIIKSLPAKLRENQVVFNHTGGLHAACLFDEQGNPMCWREDVGRHNALDKVLGVSFMANKWPLDHNTLLVSSRISFELVQKAMRAGIRIMAAMGAPSSLAVALAKKADITILGFVTDQRFNIYHGSHRVQDPIKTSS